MTTRNRILTLAWVIGLITLTCLHVSSAQAFTYSDKKQSFDALYTQLLANPGDVDLNIQYAELAVELGDYEAAISPLERVLLTHPGEAQIQLELGVLYYLLGSYDVSKNYLTAAQAGAEGDTGITSKATDYLSRM